MPGSMADEPCTCAEWAWLTFDIGYSPLMPGSNLQDLIDQEEFRLPDSFEGIQGGALSCSRHAHGSLAWRAAAQVSTTWDFSSILVQTLKEDQKGPTAWPGT